MVSVLNVLLGETLLALAFGFWHWSARLATLFATGVATFPAYFLSRTWVWGRRGRSSFAREILPFWALAFLGLGLAVWAAGLAETFARHLTAMRGAETVVVMSSTLAAFGVVWVARFVILDAVLFRASAESVASGRGDA
jgi:putative flippase GtrA